MERRGIFAPNLHKKQYFFPKRRILFQKGTESKVFGTEFEGFGTGGGLCTQLRLICI